MTTSALVTTDWLDVHRSDPDVRILDGSWYLPSAGRDARREYAEAHIPGARFFDIDEIADRSVDLPHMLPSAEQFAVEVASLGISNPHHVVIYDGAGLLSAPRVWWTFRVMGHARISVLDGGLPKWRAEGRAVTDEVPTAMPTSYRAELQPGLLHTLEQMRAAVKQRPGQILDARSAGRFAGRDPEPRANLRGGRMPDSRNLPWDKLVTPQGRLPTPDTIREVIAGTELNLDDPIVTTCGSGITAALLALALFEIGRPDVAVYDGSWAEWGGRDDTEVVTG